MKKMIWWDMDGTLGDLYGVENWLAKLRAYDASPYAEAKVMHNMSRLARLMNQVQKLGYGLGIDSWLAKDSTPEYDEAVTTEKHGWLGLHLASVKFDAIHIVEYGTPKTNFMVTEDDILFDDNEAIRNGWTGEAHTPDEIFDVLEAIIAKG